MRSMLFHRDARRLGAYLRKLVVLAAVLCALAVAPAAHASRSICRSDPVVVLSNGTAVTLTADVQTDTSNIQSVTYTLHAPAGARILVILYYGSIPRQLEHFVLVNDQVPNHYHSATRVETNDNDVEVTAVMSFVLRSGSASGSSNSNVDVYMVW